MIPKYKYPNIIKSYLKTVKKEDENKVYSDYFKIYRKIEDIKEDKPKRKSTLNLNSILKGEDINF